VEGACTCNVSVGKTEDVGSLSFETVSTCPGRNIWVLSPIHPESLPLISRGLQKHRHRDHRTQFLRVVLWCGRVESKISLATTNLVANTFPIFTKLQIRRQAPQALLLPAWGQCHLLYIIVLICFFIRLSQITQVKHSTVTAISYKLNNQQ